MKSISWAVRIVTCICLAAFLFAAITHPGELLPIALLAPFWIFLATIVVRPTRSTNEVLVLLTFPVLPVFSPRPPPVR